MGMPSLAFDTVRGRQVLLKRLPSRAGASRERFLDEIRLSETIGTHPNLARTIDAGAIDGREYLAVEWIAGADLEHIVETAGRWNMPIPTPIAVAIMWQVLKGLGHLHQHGCIHRDISAANVVVGYDGVTHLIDYGIAKFDGKQSKTILGATLGTHGFVAPELQEQKPATERSDLYAVAAALWFLLTGLKFLDRGVDNGGKEVLASQLRERGRMD